MYSGEVVDHKLFCRRYTLSPKMLSQRGGGGRGILKRKSGTAGGGGGSYSFLTRIISMHIGRGKSWQGLSLTFIETGYP
jgi:hypothetical protein